MANHFTCERILHLHIQVSYSAELEVPSSWVVLQFRSAHLVCTFSLLLDLYSLLCFPVSSCALIRDISLCAIYFIRPAAWSLRAAVTSLQHLSYVSLCPVLVCFSLLRLLSSISLCALWRAICRAVLARCCYPVLLAPVLLLIPFAAARSAPCLLHEYRQT